MKYNPGNKVKVKSQDWYYENADDINEVKCDMTVFVPDMKKYCGNTVTIMAKKDIIGCYEIEEDGGCYYWTDEMFEHNDDQI